MKRAAIIAGVLFLVLVLVRLAVTPGAPVNVSGGGKATAPEAPSDTDFRQRVRTPALARAASGFQVGPEFLKIFSAFKYYLAPHGFEAMIDGFRQWALEHYPAEEAAFLTDLFEKYIRYLQQLENPGGDFSTLTSRERYELMRSMREKIFGKELADQLFAEENAKVELGLAMMDIQQDKSLTEEERAAKMKELMDSLDPEMREKLLPNDPQREYHERLDKIDEDFADLSPEEKAGKVRELRMEMFGEEATGRLEQLDYVRAERTERMSMYQEELAALQARSDLTEEQRAAETKRLQEELLRPEQVRQLRIETELQKIDSAEIAQRIQQVQNGEIEAPDWDSPAQRGENIPLEEGAAEGN